VRPSLQGLVRAACLSSLVAGSAAFAETSLDFSGDAGDYVTQGQTYAYTPADGTFQARLEDGLLLLDFQGPNVSDYWSVRAEAPENESLTAGTTYFDAERASVPKSGPFAGFDFFGNHRGCNRIAAHFRVKRLELSQAGVVNAAWIVFESHCPPLTGTIHGRGDAVALLGPDDDPAKIQHMANILVKMDQAEIDAIEARGIAEEEGQQAAE